jgi:hypothetical protein
VARKGVVTTIKMDGPFFRQDPVKTFRQNARVMLDAIAAEGEMDVDAQLRAGNSGRRPISALGGHVSHHVVGYTTSVRTGKRWALAAAVNVVNEGYSTVEGVSLMAATAVLEGRLHAFRKTKNRLGRTRKANAAELIKGM